MVDHQAAPGVDQQIVREARQCGVARELDGEVPLRVLTERTSTTISGSGTSMPGDTLARVTTTSGSKAVLASIWTLGPETNTSQFWPASASALVNAWSMRRLMRACATVSAAMAWAGAGPRTGTGSPSISSQRSPSGRRLAHSRKGATVIRSSAAWPVIQGPRPASSC